MHLLNTLPQRLDPGATPTFAGLIAPSLTSPAASPLTLGTTDSGAAITVLSASNNVGIGTTTPAQKLQVGSTADATNNFIRIATDSSRSQGISFLRSGSIETVLAVVAQKLQYAINPASNADADLVAASKFTIDNAGNVGIGTVSPTAKLHAYSGASGVSPVTGSIGVMESNGNAYFSILGPTADAKGVFFGSPTSQITAGIVYNYDAVNALSLRAAGATRLRIADTGDVSIASSTAGSASAGALVVTGGLSAGGASYIGGVLTANSGAFNGQNAPASGASTEIIFGSNTGTVQAYDRTNSVYKTMAISGSSVVLQPNGTAQLTATTTGTTIAGNLTVSGTGTSTFAGAVTLSSVTPEIVMSASSGNPSLRFSDTTGTVNNRNWRLTSNNSANGDFVIMRSLTTGADAATAALSFDRAGAATFAGAVTTGALTVSSANLVLSAGYELRFGAGGNDRIYQSATSGGSLIFDAGGATRLTLNSTAATFAGAVTIAGTVIHTLSATPASASATGTVGTMSWDASYIYICTATNTWKRVAIATW